MPSDVRTCSAWTGSPPSHGATGGIGEATPNSSSTSARRSCCRPQRRKLAETCERLGAGADCSTAIADSTTKRDRGRCPSDPAAVRSLDILVANAGTEGVLKPIEALSVEDSRRS